MTSWLNYNTLDQMDRLFICGRWINKKILQQNTPHYNKQTEEIILFSMQTLIFHTSQMRSEIHAYEDLTLLQ